jgi:hypothetical protein
VVAVVADYTEVIAGRHYTSQASGTLTGGNVVMVSGSGTVAIATAAGAAAVCGVVGHDAVNGQKVDVISGGIHDLVSQGAIVAGTPVTVGTVNGSVATIGAATFSQMIGVALTTGVDTALVRVLLLR